MKIERTPSMIVADKVLTALRKLLVGWNPQGGAYASLRPYYNGREQGYSVSVFFSGPQRNHRTVVFSENRNSDHIVVYKEISGAFWDRLTDEMYEARKMFRTPQQAAEFCSKFIRAL